MIRSRMFTTAFRFFAGLAAASLVAAFVVGFTSETQKPMDRILGPITMGWKGSVGNHFAYTVFVGLFFMAAALAGILIAFRDADPEAEAQVVRADSVPLTRAPAGNNYMPALGGFGFVLAIVGLATEADGLAIAGLAVIVAVAVTWTLRAWAERATGDDEVNAELYHRFIDPLRVPVVAAITIAFVVLALSRVLLAVSKTGSVVVFGAVATVFFVIAVLLALYPKSTRTIATIVVVFAALAILVAGVIGAFVGERDIEHHGGETPAEGATTEGAAPAASTVTVVLPGSLSS
jgi:hypothetical protein